MLLSKWYKLYTCIIFWHQSTCDALCLPYQLGPFPHGCSGNYLWFIRNEDGCLLEEAYVWTCGDSWDGEICTDIAKSETLLCVGNKLKLN